MDFLVHDVASAESWEVVVNDVISRHGRIDVLINNAGILRRARLVNHKRRDMEPDNRDKPDGCLLRHEICRSTNDQARVRVNREHKFRCWVGSDLRADGIWSQ